MDWCHPPLQFPGIVSPLTTRHHIPHPQASHPQASHPDIPQEHLWEEECTGSPWGQHHEPGQGAARALHRACRDIVGPTLDTGMLACPDKVCLNSLCAVCLNIGGMGLM